VSDRLIKPLKSWSSQPNDQNYSQLSSGLKPVERVSPGRSLTQADLPRWPVSATDTESEAEAPHLDSIKAHIDLVLLALESLVGIGSEAMLQAAADLGLGHVVDDRVSLWRLRQSNPLRRGTGGRKKLDVEEARSLVLISCHLARQHQATIRGAVAVLEKLTASGVPSHQSPQLGDYLDTFTNVYQDRMIADHLSADALASLALKLLVDLLFYSSDQGARRLWLALLERSDQNFF
jgi:hypothetical protein